jgi:hypothetical protein
MSRITPTFEVTLSLDNTKDIRMHDFDYADPRPYNLFFIKSWNIPEPLQHGEPADIVEFRRVYIWAGGSYIKRVRLAPFGLGAFNPLNVERTL